MDYAALKAEIALSKYGGMTDAQIAVALVAEAVTVAQPVERGVARQAFDNMASAQGVPVWEAIEAARDAQTPLGMACRAALRLRDAPGDYPPINMSSPALTGMVAILAAEGGPLTTEQQTSFLALGSTTTTRAVQLGLAADTLDIEQEIAAARIWPGVST